MYCVATCYCFATRVHPRAQDKRLRSRLLQSNRRCACFLRLEALVSLRPHFRKKQHRPRCSPSDRLASLALPWTGAPRWRIRAASALSCRDVRNAADILAVLRLRLLGLRHGLGQGGWGWTRRIARLLSFQHRFRGAGQQRQCEPRSTWRCVQFGAVPLRPFHCSLRVKAAPATRVGGLPSH